MKKILIVSSSVFSAFVLCLGLSSCSGLFGGAPGQHRELNKDTYASAQPSDFDGPWADSFASAVSSIKSDYVYNILKDSKITDQEFQETQNAFGNCIKGKGWKVKFGGPDVLGSYLIVTSDYSAKAPGGMGDGIPPEAEKAADECNAKYDYNSLATLYYRILWNPQKEDLSAYSAECLVKLNYAKPGYTADEYKQGFGDKLLTQAGASYGHEDEYPADSYGIGSDGIQMKFSDYVKCSSNPKLIVNEINEK